MGFLTGNKKTSTTQNATNTNFGFSEVEGSAVAVHGSNNTITDLGAISKAMALGESSLDFASGALSDVLDLSGANTRASLDFSNSSLGKALDFGRLSLDKNADLAGEVIRANNATTQQFGERISGFAASSVQDQGDQVAQIGRWLIVGMVIVGGFFAFRKGHA